MIFKGMEMRKLKGYASQLSDKNVKQYEQILALKSIVKMYEKHLDEYYDKYGELK